MTDYLMEVAKSMERYRLDPENSERKYARGQMRRFYDFLRSNCQDGTITEDEVKNIATVAFGNDFDFFQC